jgi:pilus assembly protein CpaE
MTTGDRSLSLVALEGDPTAVMTIRTAAKDGQLSLVALASDLDSVIATTASHRPMLALLDLAQIGPDAASAVHSVLAASPETCVVVTGADATPRVISKAVSAGARAFLLRPFTADELASTLQDAHRDLTEIRRLQRGEPTTPKRGTLIAVYSPKGGVGCTTIATNLAVALGATTKRSVAVVDLDLQFGDVGVALDVRSANSVVDLVTHIHDLDPDVIDEVFVTHESGIRVLVAPENIAVLDSVDPMRIVGALETLRDHFAFIVCDLWSSLDELTLATLRAADRIVLVTTPELPALKNIRKVVSATEPLLQDDRTQIVLNRYPGKVGVSISDVEHNLGRAVSATIASEGIGVTDAINQGISFFDARARVRVGRSYLRLAEMIDRQHARRPVAVVGSAARA